MTGFEILSPAQWSKSDAAAIQKYFKGKHKEWTKASLANVRDRLRKKLLKQQNYACAYCRRRISIDLGRNEIDHIVAKAIVGMERFTYERMNLVAACKPCNKNKTDDPVLSATLTPNCPYPIGADDFNWIHPYLHRYSEHLLIREGYIFEAIGDEKQKARALAVIESCQLARLKTLEKRRAYEEACGSINTNFAILTLISNFTHYDNEQLAKIIRRARPEFKGRTWKEVEKVVISVRNGSSESYLKSMRAIGL